MQGTALKIGQFLAVQAQKKRRTTYEETGKAIGWSHPNGRGLGKYLYELLRYCKDRGLPPLTTILVQKGERKPAPDSMRYILEVLGSIDIDNAQQEVFTFDWNSLLNFRETPGVSQVRSDIWLTSFWGFDPKSWGCIGFTEASKRNYFLNNSSEKPLVAIYITKGKGPDNMRGRVVGILEVSREGGHAKEFISGDTWARTEADPEARGKWLYALKVTRAWQIIAEEWYAVEDLFPDTYSDKKSRYIGAQGVKLSLREAEKLLSLTVYEVPVYGATGKVESGIQSFSNALTPSKAVSPATEPYWVGETDGPKHLYILRLVGDIPAYLGRAGHEVDERMIVKVGFSKSPLSRRDQIQSAYPVGQFNWEVLYPEEPRGPTPYPNAAVAIAGEDAMKKRLVEEGQECLGGEFFLADEGSVIRTWNAGKFAAQQKMNIT
jgi:hypothetical protein